MKPKQKAFWEVEDTPLFSGVAMSAKDEVFDPPADIFQPVMEGIKCQLCHDTGFVGRNSSVCTCEEGQKIRKEYARFF